MLKLQINRLRLTRNGAGLQLDVGLNVGRSNLADVSSAARRAEGVTRRCAASMKADYAAANQPYWLNDCYIIGGVEIVRLTMCWKMKNLKDLVIPRSYLEAITTIATLSGLVLADITIAQSIANGQSIAWPLFGLLVAILSTVSLLDRLFDCFGPVGAREARLTRLVGGGMALVIICLHISLFGLFWI